MPLWRRGGFAEDFWTFLADDAPAPDEGPIVVSLKRWLAERETLEARTAPVGVAVEAGADAQAHLADLAGRPLVALAFAKFADGRAFSYARMLRDRFGFRGELRGDRRRADRRDPAHAALRLRFVRGERPADRERASRRPPARAADPLPAGQRGDETPAGARPWLRVSVGEGARGARRRIDAGAGLANPASPPRISATDFASRHILC